MAPMKTPTGMAMAITTAGGTTTLTTRQPTNLPPRQPHPPFREMHLMKPWLMTRTILLKQMVQPPRSREMKGLRLTWKEVEQIHDNLFLHS